jgi:hypothetical protein
MKQIRRSPGYAFRVSRTKTRMSQSPPVKTVSVASHAKFRNPYFLPISLYPEFGVKPRTFTRHEAKSSDVDDLVVGGDPGY